MVLNNSTINAHLKYPKQIRVGMKGVCVLRKLGAGRLIEEIQLRYKWVNAVTNKEVTKAPLDVLKEMVDVT